MKREITLQKARILLVYAILAGIIVFEWHFVYSGMMALPILNGVIIAVFFIGNALIWKSLLSLDNEVNALRLIEEGYKDTHSGDVTDEVLAARRQRCLNKGVAVSRPNLLGAAFDMLMDEFWRGRSLRFRLETVQLLIGTVEHKMARDRGLISYVSGLAIFLGLIGTFIGLMEMVQSVGGIIGSLAGANASADSTQNLIKSLQTPLTGMAQGFSASLFGLFTSLALGLVGRFGNNASYSVKEQFESWLTGVSQMEQVRRNDGRQLAQPASANEAAGFVLPGFAASLSNDKLAAALARAADAQAAQAQQLEAIADRFEATAMDHAALQEILRRTDLLADEMNHLRQGMAQDQHALRGATEDAFAVLRQALGEQKALAGAIDSHIEALRASFDARLDAADRRVGDLASMQRAGFANFEASLEEAQRARDAFTADLVARQADVVAGLRRMEAQLAMAPDPALIGSAIRGVLLEGFDAIGRKLEDAARAAVATSVPPAVAPQEAVVSEIRALSRSLETSLSQGLNDVAGAFQSALTLYADLMRQTQVARSQSSAPATREVG